MTLHCLPTGAELVFAIRLSYPVTPSRPKPEWCFTKIKINFKLDLSMAGHSCH